MKLSKLYCNKPDLFGPIDFRSGLNVVLAEIRLPENRDKDTHNLGKTTLGRVIDFCFLAGRDAKFFLFKHEDLFKDFVFFMEIELADSSYVTVRRGVEEATKISFKKHEASHQDFTELPDDDWDHANLPFDRAREMLDSLLDWRAVSPWDFRKGLGYQLRSQDDFQEVFQLRRFVGSHADWKPYVAHILGFDHKLIAQHYEKETQLEEKKTKAETVKAELGGSIDDIGNIEGILLLKQKDAEKKQKLLDAFDFRQQDKERTKQLVDDIDTRIGALNSQRYSLNQSKKKIVASLEEDQILFKPEEAQRLFKEAGVLFSGQIKKDFDQLIAFNRAITEERRAYLQEDRAEIEAELKSIGAELNALGKRRSDMLGFLSGTDVFAKYKQVTDDLVTLRADIATLERQRGFLHRLQELRGEIRSLSEECTHLQSQIETNVEAQSANNDSLFSTIRLYFSEIVEDVIAHKALLNVRVNGEGHLEFRADILDDAGKATSAGLGHTYRKLLCIAFDLAVLRAHLGDKFPRFVYHDGVFESLDDRKKANRRGLRGVKLVISDSHEGIKAAASKVLKATWQRCRVHFMRNALAHAGKTQRRMVSAAIGTVFVQDSAEAARTQWRSVADQLRGKFPKLGALMDEAENDVLAFMTFPRAHWTQIYSTNPLERLNAEIKRRTNVVGIFPNDASIVRLVGAMMLEQNDEWSLNRRYMQLEGLQTISDTVPTRLSAVAR